MRRGKTVDRMATSSTTPADIARAMVGRDVALAGSSAFSGAPTTKAGSAIPGAANTPPLSVANLVVRDERGQVVVDGVTFEVAAGEILGIAGVEGNGQTELIEAIAGLRPPVTGAITLDGRDFAGLTVKQRGDAGLSHIPEDRHERGLILDYSIAENLVLGQQHHFTTRGMIDRRLLAENATRQISAYDIRPAAPGAPARALSGGNQQKIVIAREMAREFKVLLASQPTRGVDVGAIEFIHAQLRQAREAGKAILLVSADLTEILALSDRIAVMYEGRFATVMPRSGATEEVLGPYMTGAAETAA
jgi:simple sugar transport system ATP-binding protein